MRKLFWLVVVLGFCSQAVQGDPAPGTLVCGRRENGKDVEYFRFRATGTITRSGAIIGELLLNKSAIANYVSLDRKVNRSSDATLLDVLDLIPVNFPCMGITSSKGYRFSCEYGSNLFHRYTFGFRTEGQRIEGYMYVNKEFGSPEPVGGPGFICR